MNNSPPIIQEICDKNVRVRSQRFYSIRMVLYRNVSVNQGKNLENRFGFTCELHSTSAAQSDFSGRFSLSLFFSLQKTRSGLK